MWEIIDVQIVLNGFLFGVERNINVSNQTGCFLQGRIRRRDEWQGVAKLFDLNKNYNLSKNSPNLFISLEPLIYFSVNIFTVFCFCH